MGALLHNPLPSGAGPLSDTWPGLVQAPNLQRSQGMMEQQMSADLNNQSATIQPVGHHSTA